MKNKRIRLPNVATLRYSSFWCRRFNTPADVRRHRVPFNFLNSEIRYHIYWALNNTVYLAQYFSVGKISIKNRWVHVITMMKYQYWYHGTAWIAKERRCPKNLTLRLFQVHDHRLQSQWFLNISLKVVGNEKQGGSGRRQVFCNGLWPWRSRVICQLNM